MQLYRYKAKVDKIVDGDTVDVSIDLGFRTTHHTRLRLVDVDTPEVHNVKHGSPEHTAGVKATAATRQWFEENAPNFVVYVETAKGQGKYGRWIATVYSMQGYSLNEYLIEQGYGQEQ